jgi:hypothetical protein
MTSIRKLASALCLAICFSSPSNAQTLEPGVEYTTGNIVVPTTTTSGSTWTGAVYQDALTCWAGGDPGYCGPSPIVRPGDLINFSYGSSYIYQQQLVSGLLPNNGVGLQVIGYNFGFTAKNGNGWDDGRTDNLTALVRFWDNTNGRAATNLLYGTSYDLNYNFNWTNFNFSQTLPTPLGVPSIGQVQYGFIGSDNNFWAGPYGPEIYNVSFSLKYSVDPCASNPLYSPTCPGYTQALLASLPKLETSTVTATPTVTLTETNNVVEATPIVQQPVSQSSATIESSPAVTASTTTSTESQSSGSRVSLSTILSIVANEQSRISSVEKSTVEASVDQATKETEKVIQQAESTAAATVSESISVSISSPQSQMTNEQQANQSSGGGLSFFSGTSLSISPFDSNIGFKAPEPATQQTIIGNQTEEKTESSLSFSGFSAVNVLKEDTNVSGNESQKEQKTQTVKPNVPNNELAGNVSLASLGAPPAGYQAYSTMMPDSAFYAPKEIYKNQRVVDNRAGRRMFGGSDALHERMVDQQYIGK